MFYVWLLATNVYIYTHTFNANIYTVTEMNAYEMLSDTFLW